MTMGTAPSSLLPQSYWNGDLSVEFRGIVAHLESIMILNGRSTRLLKYVNPELCSIVYLLEFSSPTLFNVV